MFHLSCQVESHVRVSYSSTDRGEFISNETQYSFERLPDSKHKFPFHNVPLIQLMILFAHFRIAAGYIML